MLRARAGKRRARGRRLSEGACQGLQWERRFLMPALRQVWEGCRCSSLWLPVRVGPWIDFQAYEPVVPTGRLVAERRLLLKACVVAMHAWGRRRHWGGLASSALAAPGICHSAIDERPIDEGRAARLHGFHTSTVRQAVQCSGSKAKIERTARAGGAAAVFGWLFEARWVAARAGLRRSTRSPRLPAQGCLPWFSVWQLSFAALPSPPIRHLQQPPPMLSHPRCSLPASHCEQATPK